MLSSFCARCDSRRDATTPSSASCRSVLRPPLCVLCEDIAEGRRKLLEDRHFRSAHRFVPVIMSSHRFRGWSILPSSSPRPPPLHNGGWCTHYCDVVATIRFRNRVPYRECERKSICRKGGRRQKFSSGNNTGSSSSLTNIWLVYRVIRV